MDEFKKSFSYGELNIQITDFNSEVSDIEGKDYFREELEYIIEQGKEFINPQVCIWLTDKCIVARNSFEVDNVEFECGVKIAKQLKDAERLGIFTASVGDGVTKMYQHYTEQGDFLKAFFVDALGSISVEKAMDMAQDTFAKKQAEKGEHISNRYSPGYCGWLVKEQHKLFSLLPPMPCGISLTNSALMNPIKSISGVIGIGKNIKFTQYGCSLCNMKNCVYRKNKLTS